MAALLESQNKPGIQFLGARMSLSSCSTESSKKKKKNAFSAVRKMGSKKRKASRLSRLILELMIGFPVQSLGPRGVSVGKQRGKQKNACWSRMLGR